MQYNTMQCNTLQCSAMQCSEHWTQCDVMCYEVVR